MTLPTFIIGVVFILLLVFADQILAFMSRTFETRDPDVPECFTIDYPSVPMSQNFEDIMRDIENCENEKSLKSAYVRIMIFQGNYSESTNYLTRLTNAYSKKEAELKSHSC